MTESTVAAEAADDDAVVHHEPEPEHPNDELIDTIEPDTPFSADEAELCLVGEVLCYSDLLSDVAMVVVADDISNRKVRLVYQAMCDMGARGEPIEPVTVMEELKRTGKLGEAGGAVTVSKLIDYAYAYSDKARVLGYAKIVRRESQARRLGAVLRESMEKLSKGQSPGLAAADLESELRRIAVSSEETVEDDLAQISMDLAATLEVGVDRGMRWPWLTMTRAVGLLVPGRIWAVTAFSGGGKSTLLRALTLDLVLDGKKVAYFSIEEQGHEVLGLMSCALEGVSYTRFGQGFALTEPEIDKIRDGMNTLYTTGCLRLNKQKTWSPTQLLSKIRYYAEEGLADVVIIDHAHLISYPAKNTDEREFWIGRFAIELAALCQQTGIVALVAYQPKKPGTGGDIFRPVSPDEIRGNSEIWNIVYNTLSPFRPWIEVNGAGDALLGADGLPVMGEPFKEGFAPSRDWFFVAPGKQRIGGFGGRPVVLRFDSISGRIYE